MLAPMLTQSDKPNRTNYRLTIIHHEEAIREISANPESFVGHYGISATVGQLARNGSLDRI